MATDKNASEKITGYINELPDWSQSICKKLRNIILNADKNIIEDWKWGPHYKTESGMVCGFSAFQKHAKLTFFNGSQINDEDGLFNHCIDNEFSRSIKFTNEKEINKKLITKYITEAVWVTKNGFKRVIKDEDKTVKVPAELTAAFKSSEKAKAFFEKIPYSHKKEFVEWIASGKREETRKQRVVKAIAMMEQKAGLHDKYKK